MCTHTGADTQITVLTRETATTQSTVSHIAQCVQLLCVCVCGWQRVNNKGVSVCLTFFGSPHGKEMDYEWNCFRGKYLIALTLFVALSNSTGGLAVECLKRNV